MNNIEILEEFIDKQKSNKGTFVPTDFEIIAIENLIQENKELKTKLRKHICIEAHEQVKQLYTPNSKIKEKINYLKSLDFGTDLVTQSTANLTTICILQELLEGE